uniref:Uncharacterized protein n=1 Tax=Physcomitrium patens TaxID=3218 RepID=A9SXP6_PHYPA|nr:hypothetical protein PHYPA_017025 [Physcomitrium patens]
MGLTPFSCVTVQGYVRVVYPDGHVENLSKSCSVHDLLLGNPDYYVCGSTPYTITNRMAAEEVLEYGVTYFVCATPNAQPFLERQPKVVHRGSKILPRFSKHGVHVRELRSPTHGSQQSRKVFDYHSVTMQQLESIRNEGPEPHLAGDRPSKHLKLVFIRHCLRALRLPRISIDLMESPLPNLSGEALSPTATAEDEITQMILKSAARSELGMYVSKRQEFYLRRARRRRKFAWKPVLQSISEMKPVMEFHTPMAYRDSGSPPKNASTPSLPGPKNISPPRQVSVPQRSSPPPKNVSPPPQPAFVARTASKYSAASQQVQRNRGNAKSLYMA